MVQNSVKHEKKHVRPNDNKTPGTVNKGKEEEKKKSINVTKIDVAERDEVRGDGMGR